MRIILKCVNLLTYRKSTQALRRMQFRYWGAILSLVAVSSVTAIAQERHSSGSPAPAKASTPTSSGTVSESKPLDVRGQSRMQALIQTQDDRAEINFVKVRKNFRDEILKTSY